MRSRLAELNGRLSILSQAGKGTRIQFNFAVAKVEIRRE
jgi:signal transduction histidine kinase